LEATVYQQILLDVNRLWVEELDREAVFRRQVPRRDREYRRARRRMSFLRPRAASMYAEPQQCA
jgi:hypothetical protein